ncbi:MAG: ABC transporter substrate-binding protein [Alphaproteobacteria bacterium]|nr:ABC transporter substrate-binding protein [Alphaproteobacteria bacterium]
MKKIIVGLCIVVLVAVFGGRAYYLRKQTKSETDRIIKIGFLSDLSGFSSPSGKEALSGAQEAVKEINNKPEYGFKIKLSVQDHKFLAKDSLSAFKKALNDEIQGLIIMGSVPVLTLAPLVEQAKIPTIATSAANTEIPSLSNWMFRGWIYVKPQADLLADFIKNDLGVNEVAIFKIKNQFGDDYEDNFSQAYANLEGKVVLTESFSISDTDVKSQVAKIIDKNPKAVVVFGFEHGVAAAIDTLKEQGYSGAILTTPDAMVDYAIWKSKGADVYFTSTTWDFLDPNNKMSLHAMFAYIGTLLLAEAIKNASDNGADSIRQALLNIKNFDTPLGKISYDEKREIIFPKLLIKQMQPDGTTKIVRE